MWQTEAIQSDHMYNPLLNKTATSLPKIMMSTSLRKKKLVNQFTKNKMMKGEVRTYFSLDLSNQNFTIMILTILQNAAIQVRLETDMLVHRAAHDSAPVQ